MYHRLLPGTLATCLACSGATGVTTPTMQDLAGIWQASTLVLRARTVPPQASYPLTDSPDCNAVPRPSPCTPKPYLLFIEPDSSYHYGTRTGTRPDTVSLTAEGTLSVLGDSLSFGASPGVAPRTVRFLFILRQLTLMSVVSMDSAAAARSNFAMPDGTSSILVDITEVYSR
jgi:hypothetical protein